MTGLGCRIATLLLLMCIFGGFGGISSAQTVTCSTADRDSLLAFKSLLTDADGVLGNWKKTTDCCDGWTGVSCDSQGRVHTLFVNANCWYCVGGEKLIAKSGNFGAPLGNLKGLVQLSFTNVQIGFRFSLPTAFFSLPKLEMLQLMGCEFKGFIPKEVGKLTKLQELTVTGNRFTGGMPDTIANLKELRILSLRENEMRELGSSRVTLLRKLDRFDFAFNKISGPIPKWLAGLTLLPGGLYDEVNLSFNQLSGTIPAELCNIKNLRNLGLRTNKLSGRIPDPSKCVALDTLALAENSLSGPIPRELGKLKKLQYLFLDLNQLSGSLPRELGDLPKLTALVVDHNKLTGAIPDNYGPFVAEFESVKLANNMLTGRIPKGVQNLAVDAFRPGNPGLCGTPLPNQCKYGN